MLSVSCKQHACYTHHIGFSMVLKVSIVPPVARYPLHVCVCVCVHIHVCVHHVLLVGLKF